MAAPSLTYTLTNGTTADASQVMQNFTDLLNGITDGTKDLSISALTVAGTATLNGHVNLGNSSADDLTVTASLASSLPIKTNTSYDVGSSTLGLRALYLGGTSTFTGQVLSATLAASRVWTVPDTGANANFVMTELAQTLNGLKTFGSGLQMSNGTSGYTPTTFSYYEEGSFTGTFTGGTTSPTGTFYFIRTGSMVSILVPAVTATANTTAVGFTGLPARLSPARNISCPGVLVDNSTYFIGRYSIASAGTTILFKIASGGNLSGTGTTGTDYCMMTYTLN